MHNEHAYFWNNTYLKNEMHSYSLYYKFNFPHISLILINDNNLRLYELDTIHLIENIYSQNIANIEIKLIIKNNKARDYNLIKKRFKKLIERKNISMHLTSKNKLKITLNNVINLIRGTYTIFINHINILKNLKITKLLDFIKDKTDNYFHINITNELKTFVFRTKILKDLVDNGIEFKSVEKVINIVKSLATPHINYISISLCPDNKYSRLAYVAMSSILSSKATNTYICFYLIIPRNFEKRNYDFLESLYEIYNYFNLTFIKLDDRYDKAYTSQNITIHAYYRFSLGELLQNRNKTIYIDTDIIVYRDLNNFYNMNFNGKIFLGQQTIGNRKGFNKINSGILLMNLLEMRKKKIEKKAIEAINSGQNFSFHDQTVLNKYFNQYIGFFSPEYHTRPWSNYKEMKIFNNKSGNIVDNDYLYFAHKYPVIRHFLGKYKPNNPNINHIEDWWFFARKSKYYNESAESFEYAFTF